jgi:hypothetical protein
MSHQSNNELIQVNKKMEVTKVDILVYYIMSSYIFILKITLYPYVWILYLGMNIVPRYEYCTLAWILYLGMTIVPRYEYCTQVWILYLGMNIVPRYEYCTQVWILYLGMNIIPRFTVSATDRRSSEQPDCKWKFYSNFSKLDDDKCKILLHFFKIIFRW